METLLRGWLEEQETGFARMWEQILAPGWKAMRERQNPIEITGRRGDCEENALEVRGAADREIGVAAEWWYLYYIFGRDWMAGMHATATAMDGRHLSIHHIYLSSDMRKEAYFRLPW
jgi:hypothetical protein